LRSNKVLTADTLFEDDLGVSGDDGVDLLEAVEKEYGISLEPVDQVFHLSQLTRYFN
jgi:acyl carrier protein